jgi:hypothetical protein
MNKINILVLLYINSVLSFNLYSIIYPIKYSFNYLDKNWNYNNRLFPNNVKTLYIGKWYYYNNIDLIENSNYPEAWKENLVLSSYECNGNKIKTTKIINSTEKITSYYKKKHRTYDEYSEYYRNEHLYLNRITKLYNTNKYNKLDKKADILRTLLIRPNYCSITCTPYIPKDEIIKKSINKKNLNTSNYSISFDIWLTDSYIYNNSIRTGLYISYDGINGNLNKLILKRDNMLETPINLNKKLNLSNIIDKTDNIIKYNITNEKVQNIKDFDNGTTINYIILKNNWIGNYRIHNIFNDSNDNQISWSSEHNYFIPISNNDIHKYYELKFKDGIYANIPKNLNLFKNNDTIYIELVCFFKNGTGIQRFLAWGSKENKGIKTYCHDIWKNKVPIYYLD